MEFTDDKGSIYLLTAYPIPGGRWHVMVVTPVHDIHYNVDACSQTEAIIQVAEELGLEQS